MSWNEYANKIEVGVFRLSRMLQTFGGESTIDSDQAVINFDFEGVIDGSITIYSNDPDSCIYVKYPNTAREQIIFTQPVLAICDIILVLDS